VLSVSVLDYTTIEFEIWNGKKQLETSANRRFTLQDQNHTPYGGGHKPPDIKARWSDIMVVKKIPPLNQIVLAGEYLNGFLAAALRENLAKYDSQELDNAFITNCRKSNFSRKALELYLLFDEVHLSGWNFNFSIPSLIEEGRVKISTSKKSALHKVKALYEQIRQDYKQAMIDNAPWFREIYYLKPLILDLLQQKPLLPSLQALAVDLNIGIRPLLNTLLHELCLDGFAYACKIDPHFPESASDFLAFFPKKLLESEVDYFSIRKKGILWTFQDYLFIQAQGLMDSLELGTKLSCPVALGKIRKGQSLKLYSHSELADNVGKVLKILRIAYRNKELVFPSVYQFKDVERIRAKRGFKDFREVFLQFMRHLQLGEMEGAKKIEKELHKASRGLRSVGPTRRIGEWVTVLSLPAIALDVFLTGGIMGLTTTICGASIWAYGLIQEKRCRWILVDNK